MGADVITCTCPQIPLCGFAEGLPPNPHHLRGWSGSCPLHAAEADGKPHYWLWAGLPVYPCRCGLAEAAERKHL